MTRSSAGVRIAAPLCGALAFAGVPAMYTALLQSLWDTLC